MAVNFSIAFVSSSHGITYGYPKCLSDNNYYQAPPVDQQIFRDIVYVQCRTQYCLNETSESKSGNIIAPCRLPSSNVTPFSTSGRYTDIDVPVSYTTFGNAKTLINMISPVDRPLQYGWYRACIRPVAHRGSVHYPTDCTYYRYTARYACVPCPASLLTISQTKYANMKRISASGRL